MTVLPPVVPVPFEDLYPKLVQQIIAYRLDGPFVGNEHKSLLDSLPDMRPDDLLLLIRFNPAPGDFADSRIEVTSSSAMAGLSMALFLNCLEDGDESMRRAAREAASILLASLGWTISDAAGMAVLALDEVTRTDHPHLKSALLSCIRFSSHGNPS